MKDNMANNNFIGYEYRDINLDRDMGALYADSYSNFGWILDSESAPNFKSNRVSMKFKRDRKIRNKAELTRLQRQFDSCASEIQDMEKSKESKASIISFTVGLIGTVFMAGSTFSVLANKVLLSIILAVPAFVGWISPYFLYKSTYARRSTVVGPLIESKYDELYEICERANSLLDK